MKPSRIPSETKIIPSALPRRMPGTGDGALLIHGFTGWPGEMAFLGDRLAEAGLAVSIPRLPGHGTNARDFMETGWRDWLRTAFDAYLELAAARRNVHLVGYSLGSLIAILLACRFPVGRLCLVAPAVKISNPLLPLAPLLPLFVRRWRCRGAPPQCGVDAADEAVLAREYWSWRFAGQSASVLRLQRMANRALGRVSADTLVVLGGKDRTIAPAAWDLLRSKIGSRVLERAVFPESGHQIPSGPERGPVAAAIVNWLTASAPAATVRA